MSKLLKLQQISSFLLLAILIILLNVGTALISMNIIDYLELSKHLFYLGIGAFVLYISYKLIKKERILFKDIITIILLIFLVLSCFFAYNKEEALYGVSGRNEGMRVLFSYYMFYLLSTTFDNKKQQKIMYLVIFFGLLQVIVGTLQFLQIEHILGYDRSLNWSTNFKFASGTLGNPNFYSTYILICLIYIYSLIFYYKGFKKIFLIILDLIFGYGLLIGDTTSCIMASLICIVIILIKKINKNNLKKVFGGVILTLIGIGLFSFVIDSHLNYRITNSVKRDIEEISQIFKKGITLETGNGRIYVWQETLKKVPKYFWLGIGIDNFKYLDDGYFICNEKPFYQCFDKAHNEYLQILITEGIFVFVGYVIFLIYNFKNYYKEIDRDNKIKIAIKWVIIGYLIQAFFNIRVICVAPIFFMLLGFLISREEISHENN